MEPLGQSQVMAYLRGLSENYSVTLITFEKPEDLANVQAVSRIRADCEVQGIDWQPRLFRRRPNLVVPAWGSLETTDD